AADRAAESATLAFGPARLAASPRRLRGVPGAVAAGTRTIAHTVLPPAPASPLNRPGSPARRHVRVTCTLDDVRRVRRPFGLTPRPLQRALAHAFAHPRLFNLTVSSVAGPAVPRYLRGCRLATVHSAVPLAGRHAVSVGVVTVAGRVCFGIYADAGLLPDAPA